MAEGGEAAGAIPQAKKKQMEENARAVLMKEHGLTSDEIKSVTAKLEYGHIVFDVHFNDIERADVDHVVRNLELDGLLGDYTLKRGRSSTVGYTDDQLSLPSVLVNDASASDFDPQQYATDDDDSDDGDDSDDDSTVMSESTVGRDDPVADGPKDILLDTDSQQPPADAVDAGAVGGPSDDVTAAGGLDAAPVVRKPLRRDSILSLDANNEPMQHPSDDKVWRMPAHSDAAIDEVADGGGGRRAFLTDAHGLDEMLSSLEGYQDTPLTSSSVAAAAAAAVQRTPTGDAYDPHMEGGAPMSGRTAGGPGADRHAIEAKAFAMEALLETMLLREETDKYNRVMEQLTTAKAAIDRTVEVGRLELQYRLEEFLKEEFQRHVAEVGGVDRWMLKQSK